MADSPHGFAYILARFSCKRYMITKQNRYTASNKYIFTTCKPCFGNKGFKRNKKCMQVDISIKLRLIKERDVYHIVYIGCNLLFFINPQVFISLK